jgi:hypothetical protein
MVSYVSEKVRHKVLERDRYRCQECGVAVGGKSGCMWHTHHKILRARGGSDNQRNLATLCLVCHATKPSRGHRWLLDNMSPKVLPNHVKSLVWDLGLELIAYSEWLNPRQFPAGQVLKDLKTWQDYLGPAIESTRRTIDAKAPVIVRDQPRPETPTRAELEAVVTGLRIGLSAHVRQRYLDRKVRAR